MPKQWEIPGHTFSPAPAEATQPALKALLLKEKKKSGKGEKSDFDLGKPEGGMKGKEVR